MTGDAAFDWALLALLILTPVTLVALRLVSAPYGRHARPGWGPTISSRAGWILMESPSLVLFPILGAQAPKLLLALWLLHYGQRTLIYPLLLRQPGRPMPLAICVLGFAFNVLNVWLNTRWLVLHPQLDPTLLAIGGGLFLFGFAINLHSDHVLRTLRKPKESGYKVPHGGFYRWVSCPNYLGEIIEWIGWAIAACSPAGAAFALYTIANLGPRALTHHAWYKATFPDYPPKRTALIPRLL